MFYDISVRDKFIRTVLTIMVKSGDNSQKSGENATIYI